MVIKGGGVVVAGAVAAAAVISFSMLLSVPFYVMFLNLHMRD